MLNFDEVARQSMEIYKPKKCGVVDFHLPANKGGDPYLTNEIYYLTSSIPTAVSTVLKYFNEGSGSDVRAMNAGELHSIITGSSRIYDVKSLDLTFKRAEGGRMVCSLVVKYVGQSTAFKIDSDENFNLTGYEELKEETEQPEEAK